MTRALYIDAIGGLAGDMLLAALVDAGAPLAQVQAAVGTVVPRESTPFFEAVTRRGLHSLVLRVSPSDPRRVTPLRSFHDLTAMIDQAPLPPAVQTMARSILARLGEAEARIHGMPVDDLRLHELGDDDTLIDVVGVATALAALGVDHIYVSSLPLAVGETAHSDHGDLPLPAPATLDLLRGFPVHGHAGGELVTPTGAAIVAALATPVRQLPAMTIERVGYGAGSRNPHDFPNLARVLIGTLAPEPVRETELERDLVVVEANLDDLSPQLVADAADAIRIAGALDVWITPIQMKKGRSAVLLSALCEPGTESRVRRAFFESTSTLGVRAHVVRRTELERQTVTVALRAGTVRVKLGLLNGRVVSSAPEHDDVAALARQTGEPVRRVYEEALSAAQAARDVVEENAASPALTPAAVPQS
jgi:uncharacterized protein (TIGR00299 family) protein